MKLAAADIYDFKQQFRVSCLRDCGDDNSSGSFFIGDGCNITAVGDTTKCIGRGPKGETGGYTLSFGTCDGLDYQRFNFENHTSVFV